MDRAAFCDDADRTLRDLEEAVGAQTLATPSTLERALQQERQRPALEALRGRIAELRARVDELRAGTDPRWEQSRAAVEHDCEALRRELDEVLGAG